MSTSNQLDANVFRILLYRNNDTELLLETTPGGLRVPVLPVPAHTRIAEQITAAIKSAWGLDTYCMFSLSGGTHSSAPSPCQVMEACESGTGAVAGMHWVPVESLSASSFEDFDVFEVIERSLATFEQYRCGELHGTFGKPGWLTVVTDWVRAAATPVGLSLTGKFRQFNASPTFSLIRFETGGPALWFKAAGEPNLHEHRVTLKMVADFPEFVPQILAVREDWNAWLTVEVEGCHPDENSSLDMWIDVATTLADLQIASIGKTFLFIDAGCRDIRVPALTKAVTPYLQAAAELMDEQTKNCPPRMNQEEIKTLEAILLEALTHLENLHLPDALGHLDFNPGNILVNGHRVVFLDWSAAGVGCPLLTIEYLLERLCRIRPSFRASWRNEVLSAYLQRYHFLLRPQELAAALAATPLIAVFAYAVASGTWSDPGRRRDPETAAHFRSLTRRMHREAQLWIRSSGSLCGRLG